MMTVDEMNRWKQELGYSYHRIAELSGLPVGTVQKVLGGISRAPREGTLKKLEEVFTPFTRSDREDLEEVIQRYTYRTAEPVSHYFSGTEKEKQQGEYTIEDLYALPEGTRMELIDGVLYDMTMEAPSLAHQAMISFLHGELRSFIRRKKGSCMVFPGPVDVQVKRDQKNMVEPDLLVLCDPSKLLGKKIYGAPELVVEVLSPSTAKKDRREKAKLYEDAGVREYWIIDLKQEKLLVSLYGGGEEGLVPMQLYTFDSQVPVSIYGGECSIDFQEIRDELRRLQAITAENEASLL